MPQLSDDEHSADYLESSSSPEIRGCVAHVTDEDIEVQRSKNLAETT